MQFSVVATLAALAAVASAGSNETVVYTTEIHTAYTTYCPEATTLTLGTSTYTVSEATTLTITDCPCTIVKPITTSSVVVPTSAPVYANSTTAAYTKTAVGTTSVKSSATATPTNIEASGAEKAMTFSGLSLAGLLAAAAYIL